MVSCEHDTDTIYNLFNKFMKFSAEDKRKITFNVLVTDFSYSTNHAACHAFNKMSLHQYLQMCFDVLRKKARISSKYKRIKLCCAHLMKNISRHASEITSPLGAPSTFFEELMACAFEFRFLAGSEEWHEICLYSSDPDLKTV